MNETNHDYETGRTFAVRRQADGGVTEYLGRGGRWYTDRSKTYYMGREKAETLREEFARGKDGPCFDTIVVDV